MNRHRGSASVRELAVFAVLVIILWRGASIHCIHHDLNSFLANQRNGLYTTLLTVEATLLGFIIAVLAIVLGYAQADRFKIVRDSRHWHALFGSYTRAMRWSAYATASLLAGLLIDRDQDPHPTVTVFCVASLLMASTFLARMLWITERVVRVVTTPAARAPGE
jgi:hypothetical protein